MFGLMRQRQTEREVDGYRDIAYDFVWIDATENFAENLTGQITKHPLEDGSSITDHFVKSNRQISISGVFSDADFNNNYPVSVPIREARSVTGQQPNANSGDNRSVEIKTSSVNPLTKFLPESITSLLVKEEIPEVEIYGYKSPKNSEVKAFLEDCYSNGDSITVYGYDRKRKLKDVWKDCVITSLSFKESSSSEDVLNVDIGLEQIRKVTLKITNTPKYVEPQIQASASDLVNTGNKQANSGTVNPTNAVNPDTGFRFYDAKPEDIRTPLRRIVDGDFY